MGKSFSKNSNNDKRAERQREKERRNLRGKRRIVFEKPQPYQTRKDTTNEYTY